MQAEPKQAALVPGYILFSTCALISFMAAFAVSEQWLGAINIPWIAEGVQHDGLLIANLLLFGVAVWIGTIFPGTTFEDSWIKERFPKFSEFTRRRWVFVTWRVAFFSSIAVAVQWVVVSRNFWWSLTLFIVLTASAARALAIDTEVVERFDTSLGSKPEAAVPKQWRSLLKWLVSTEAGLSRTWNVTLALWFTSGLVYCVGQIPTIDYARPVDTSPVGRLMDVRAKIPLAFFSLWLVVTGFQAAHRLSLQKKSRPKQATGDSLFITFVRHISSACINAIVDGARYAGDFGKECYRIMWDHVREKNWLYPLLFEFWRIVGLAVILVLCIQAGPVVIVYCRDTIPFAESIKEFALVSALGFGILVGCYLVTFRIHRFHVEDDRYTPRLLALIGGCVTASLLCVLVHWGLKIRDIDILRPFAIPGPALLAGFVLVVSVNLYTRWRDHASVDFPATLKRLTLQLKRRYRTLSAYLQANGYGKLEATTVIHKSAVEAMAKELGIVVKFHAPRKLTLRPNAENKYPLADVAKAMGVNVEQLLPQMEATKWTNLSVKSHIAPNSLPALGNENGFLFELSPPPEPPVPVANPAPAPPNHPTSPTTPAPVQRTSPMPRPAAPTPKPEVVEPKARI